MSTFNLDQNPRMIRRLKSFVSTLVEWLNSQYIIVMMNMFQCGFSIKQPRQSWILSYLYLENVKQN